MKKNNNKGFTLAELLIVVAIIGVLIAIAMPTFGSQLEKARIAADQANLRAAYGEAVAAYLTNPDTTTNTTIGGVTVNGNTAKVTITLTHKATDSATALTGTWLDDTAYSFPFKPSLAAAKLGKGSHDFTFTFASDGTASITSCT